MFETGQAHKNVFLVSKARRTLSVLVVVCLCFKKIEIGSVLIFENERDLI